MDKHTSKDFLKKAFDSNKYVKEKYEYGEIKTYKDIPGWLNDSEWIYENVVNESEDGDIFLEIGTFFGQSAARMCELIRDSKKNLKFYSMDIFYEIEAALMLDRHPTSFKEFRNNNLHTDIFNLVNDIFKKIGLDKYVEFICCDSKYGHKLFDDNLFKMVYVDGNHSYDSVYNDLINFYPKVKDGGSIICDDIIYDSVSDAIRDFCVEKKIPPSNVSFNTNSCIIKKGEIDILDIKPDIIISEKDKNNKKEMSNNLDNPFYVKVKQELDSVGCGMCLAKWTQVTLQLQSGHNHSCHHPKTHKISEQEIKRNPSALHNTRFKKLKRKEMLGGIRPEECDYCWNTEDTSNRFSDRVFKSAENWSWNFKEEIFNSNWRDDYNPRYVEVSFSSACNFKCSYCGPSYSTKWMEEINTHGGYPTTDNFNSLEWMINEDKMPILPNKNNPYLDAFWKWWPELYYDLHTFRITGGEPLIVKDTWDILDFIINNSNPNKELKLAINTNLGVSDKLIDKLIDKINKIEDEHRVKELIIFTSVDSWGEQAEYGRNGLVFNRFWDNVNKILTKCNRTIITFMSTYNALSVTNYSKLITEVYKLKEIYGTDDRYWNSATFLDTSYLRYPEHQTVRILPNEFSNNILSQSKLAVYYATPSYDSREIGYADVEVQKIRRIYDWMISKQDDLKLNMNRYNFYQFFNEHDKRRGTNFVDTFPELEDFYKKCKEIKL